jgi:hypothetical protein
VIFLWSNDSGRSLIGPLLLLGLVVVGGIWVAQNSNWVARVITDQPSAHASRPIVPSPPPRGKTAPPPKAKPGASTRITRAGSKPALSDPVSSDTPAPTVTEEPVPHAAVVYGADDLDIVAPTPLRLSQMVDALPPGVPSQRAVALELLIDESGSVESVHRLSPPNPVRDAVAVSVAKGMRFRPGTKDGHAVRYRKVVWYVIPE